MQSLWCINITKIRPTQIFLYHNVLFPNPGPKKWKKILSLSHIHKYLCAYMSEKFLWEVLCTEPRGNKVTVITGPR